MRARRSLGLALRLRSYSSEALAPPCRARRRDSYVGGAFGIHTVQSFHHPNYTTSILSWQEYSLLETPWAADNIACNPGCQRAPRGLTSSAQKRCHRSATDSAALRHGRSASCAAVPPLPRPFPTVRIVALAVRESAPTIVAVIQRPEIQASSY